MRRFNILAIAATVALFMAVSCSRNKELASKPPSLILVPGAHEVKYHKENGSDQLVYCVSVEYPAKEVLARISNELARQGWQPMAEDWLNPGLKSSHLRGWSSFGDATTNPKTYVFQWLAQWQDVQGNVVLYALQYRDPEGPDAFPSKPETIEMKVVAAFTPAAVAKHMMKWAAEDQHKQEKPR